MSRALLCLVMIVKDEAKSIRRTLLSARAFVDHWLILDTGSTDGTQRIVGETLVGVPGKLVEEPFVDFSTTRNRALELADGNAEFLLMLSGDEVLRGDGPELRRWLESARTADLDEAYSVTYRFGANLDGKSDRITRSGGSYRYVGVTHEALCHPEGVTPEKTAPLLVHYDPQEPQDKTERWKLDMQLLRREVAERPTGRTMFYLAQTYACLGMVEAAHWAYSMRAQYETGFQEERYEAAFRAAQCARLTGWEWSYVKERFREAHTFAPHRAEPLVEIAEHEVNCERPEEALVYAKQAASLPEPTWVLPPLDEIFDQGQDVMHSDEYDRMNARIIEDSLASFGAPGKVVEIKHGPTITMFGVEPDFIESRGGKTRSRSLPRTET